MGQVIPLAAFPAGYPTRMEALDRAECVLLVGLRWWVADSRQGQDPLHRLCETMATSGAHDAAFSLDSLMAIIARTTRRPIAVNCPRCPQVTDDEKRLLHAASLAQAGQAGRAERLLRNAMLSAMGAQFAMGPLEGLGALFAQAGLRFSQRAGEVTMPEHGIEAWMPAAGCTVH